MHYVACYVHRYIKMYHNAYTTVSLRMNPRGSKHVGVVNFVGLCCISQCTVQKKKKKKNEMKECNFICYF